jgi:type VI secretion system secreted protein VgrG
MGKLQANRVCKINTPYGEDVALANRLTGTESISELFRWEVDVSADPHDLEFPKILGQPVTLEIDLAGDRDRFINGIVSRITQLESPGEGKTGGSAYTLEVVPWTWLLTRRQDSRIFQEMTIPDIIKKVFDDLGFVDYEFKLKGSYDPLVNCVQYQETDFAFVSRLLEAEGIFYYYTHEEERHVMVMTDAVDQVPPMPGMASGAGAAAG